MFHNKLKVIYLTITFLSTTPCQSGNDSNSETAIGVRILNGMAADDFQFPYQVSLQKHRKHHCGGSIISKVKVLTAGHCVTDRNGAKLPTASFTILAGTIKLNAKEYWFSLKKISIHPKFNRRIVQYDCSVIFIDGIFDFQLHKRIAAIPLASQNPEPGTVCYLSGWGNIQKNSEIRFPNELQFARITVDQPEECTKVFENFVPLQMLCAGRTNNENAGCGDSGWLFQSYYLQVFQCSVFLSCRWATLLQQ